MVCRVGRIYSCIDDTVGGLFARYGHFVARHAWKIIIVTCIVNVGLAFGMLTIQKNINTEDSYMPMGTDSRRDRDRVASLFSDLSGSNYNTLQIDVLGAYAGVYVKSRSGDLLTADSLTEIRRLDSYIRTTTATADNGDTITLPDICAKVTSGCFVTGELFASAEFSAAVVASNVSYPTFLTTHGVEYYASGVAGVTTDTGGTHATAIEYIAMTYVLRTDDDKYADLNSNWVHALQNRMEGFQSDIVEVAFGHYESLDEELDKNVSGDISLFAVTFTLMITYANLATMTARCDNVGQRVNLGFAGVLAAGLAITSGFGLISLAGVEFVSIVGVVPFLVIGIGIDDMFIMLSGLAGAQGKTSVEEKMADMLRTSGVGITITSLTDLLAFMAGASSSFMAVRNFCIYTGTAVIFCYVNNITLFAASCAINERRVHGSRHYATFRQVKSRVDYSAEGRSARYMICCAGTAPTTRQQSESYLDKLPRLLIPKIVLRFPLKMFICLSFAGYLAASIYGCVRMEQGLKFKQLVPDDSYYYKYASWMDDVFPMELPVSLVIDRTYTYHTADTQSRLAELIASYQTDGFFDDNYKVSWLDVYKTSQYYNGANELAFIVGLKDFYSATEYRRFENDVTINDASDAITSSRVYVLAGHMSDSQTSGNMMLRAREIASAAYLSIFPYHSSFVAFEQYVVILGQTLQTVGIALAAVFLVTCIFMPHPLLIFYVTVVVAMIMAGVLGFLLYLDLTLSSITMVHVIMCIGFSVDFAAHICHGFMTSRSDSREERVKDAIDKTGAPIFHGALSSFIGVIILLTAKSYIFVTFAKVMSLVLVFGMAHALFLLPVVLSWIGPARMDTFPRNDTEEFVSNVRMDSIVNRTKTSMHNRTRPHKWRIITRDEDMATATQERTTRKRQQVSPESPVDHGPPVPGDAPPPMPYWNPDIPPKLCPGIHSWAFYGEDVQLINTGQQDRVMAVIPMVFNNDDDQTRIHGYGVCQYYHHTGINSPRHFFATDDNYNAIESCLDTGNYHNTITDIVYKKMDDHNASLYTLGIGFNTIREFSAYFRLDFHDFPEPIQIV